MYILIEIRQGGVEWLECCAKYKYILENWLKEKGYHYSKPYLCYIKSKEWTGFSDYKIMKIPEIK